MLQTAIEQEAPCEIPAQVKMILSAMEAGGHRSPEHRNRRRIRLHVQGVLRLFSDSAAPNPRTLYTRDIHSRAMGFICPDRLPLGHGGTVELTHPDRGTVIIPCTIIRCRQALEGWYEGSVAFSRVFSEFDAPVA